jgi:hypothetical protein
VTSIAVIFLLFRILDIDGLDEAGIKRIFFIFGLILGFLGIFAGSCCLEQAHRKWGSFILLLLGLTFSSCVVSYNGIDDGDIYLHWMLPLALGGLGAVILAFRRRARKS